MEYNFEENWDDELDDFDDDYEPEPYENYDDFEVVTSGAGGSRPSPKPKSQPKPSTSSEEKIRRGPQSNLKVEMKNVYLNKDSRNLIMDTLRSINGQNFSLENDEMPVTSKRELSRQYWMDQGQLVVRNAYNYSNRTTIDRDKVNSFALENLELYGFYTNHCCEALLEGNNEFENALQLLSSFYFGVRFSRMSPPLRKNISEKEDEIVALRSIYDTMCEERVPNKHWIFHLDLPYLGEWYFKNSFKQNANLNNDRKKPLCWNYNNTGKCRFGSNCKFSHEIAVNSTSNQNDQGVDVKLKSAFNLEIRFPEDCNYPEDIPLIMFSAEHKEFSAHVCLRITKVLYREASSCAEHGSPYCYNLIQFLLSQDCVLDWLNDEATSQLNISRDSSLINTPIPEPMEVSTSTRFSNPVENTAERRNAEAEKANRDEDLIKNIRTKQNNHKFKEMQKYRKSLPAWSVGSCVFSALEKHQVIVVVGETGCGKSTQIPQFILDEWLYSVSGLWDHRSNYERVNIICTQPRRLSAIGVATRVAEERIENPGESVGYQIRLESCTSSLTRLLFCTTGILLKKLEGDPFLSDVTHVIVDEVHERDEDSDFLLLILKELIQVRRDLKVILMSATLNADLFSKYFYDAPLIDIPGKMYPVEEMYIEDILERCDYTLDEYSKFCRKVGKGLSKQIDSLEYALYTADSLNSSTVSRDSSADECLSANQLYYRYRDYSVKTRKTILLMDTAKIDPELVLNVLTWIVDGNHDYPREGSILVFLPGLADIITIHDELSNHRLLSPRTGRFMIVPLHSTISNEEQYGVFRKPPKGVRKIVLSTNIAETSVTIDDCVFVVDCGKMKVTMFDSNKNMSSLETVWISRANARQRRGRAGRVMPGLCIRLYTRHRFEFNFTGQPIPEIQRAALDQIILRLKTLQSCKNRTAQEVLANLLEPPELNNIETALERLRDIGALDVENELTALGRHLAALPVDVKIGKLILFGAIFCCLDPVLTIAAGLSHKSPFVSPFNKRDAAQARKKQFAVGNSDHLTLLNAYQKWLEASNSKRHWGRRFAEENFLNWRTLETIGDLKHQFLELLMSIGFVPSNTNLRRRKHEDRILQVTSKSINVNSNNNKLLAAILCAALYPNLVKIFTPGKVYVQSASGAIPRDFSAEEIKFKTKQDGYVFLHPSSINHDTAVFQSPYLVYQEKMKTSKVFIHDSTMVSIISLILFAGNELKIERCSGLYTVSLENGWLVFSIECLQDAKMLQHMRIELNKLLEKKIEDPKLDLVTDFTGKKIISTITHIISNTFS